MKQIVFLISLVFFSVRAIAQDQYAFRLQEKGISKIVQIALRAKLGEDYSKNIRIPKDRYGFTIKKEDLASNPIINVLSQITDFDFNKDLDFFLKTSNLDVSAFLKPESVKTFISGSKSQGINVQVAFELARFKIVSEGLSLCEDKGPKPQSCGAGLKVSASNIVVKTYGRPVKMKVNFKILFKNDTITFQVVNVSSNLQHEHAPQLDISLDKLTIPPVSIVIDGQETELDTTHVKDQLFTKKAFLAQKLLSFSAEFIANDLAKLMNDYLKHKHIGTDIDVYQHGNKFIRLVDNNPVDIMKVLMEQIQKTIKQARVGLKLKNLTIPENKHMEFSGTLKLQLNDTTIQVGSTIGNSDTLLAKANLAKYGSEFILAISEPLLNGVMDLVNSTGLFQDAFDAIAKEKSISLKDVKIHFTSEKKLKLITNIEIDLKKLRTSFWKDPRAWAESEIGIWLERNNNNSVIYFPLEFTLDPVIQQQEASQEAYLYLKMDSVFSGDELVNTYGYPSNVKKMFQVVRKGVLAKLHQQFDDLSGKLFKVDLKKLFSQSRIQVIPKEIDFDQSSYIILGFDFHEPK